MVCPVVLFSVGICVVCPSAYVSWFPIWYLQAFLLVIKLIIYLKIVFRNDLISPMHGTTPEEGVPADWTRADQIHNYQKTGSCQNHVWVSEWGIALHQSSNLSAVSWLFLVNAARLAVCRSLFVLLYFFFWPLCFLFFFDLRILITSLVSSNSSKKYQFHSFWLDPIEAWTRNLP
jgi:hypothetical protein